MSCLLPLALLQVPHKTCKLFSSFAKCGKYFLGLMWSTLISVHFLILLLHLKQVAPYFAIVFAFNTNHSLLLKNSSPLFFIASASSLSVSLLSSSLDLCFIVLALTSSVFMLTFGDCLSKAQPYRNKTGFALCSMLTFGAMSSHRTTSDCFNHRALRIRPRSQLWLARVTGYLKPDHRRTASGCPKAKTLQDTLRSWLLARATTRRLTRIKNLACCRARPHSSL